MNENNRVDKPLAYLLRPNKLTDIVGQDHLLAENSILNKMISSGRILSMLFWGPPGCGKTSVCELLVKELDCRFVTISAVFTGVSQLKKIFEEARLAQINNKKTVLFIDEIHRFNKSQQDSLLPVIEDGTIICIGATTENPSFELNAALLSRMQVVRFQSHNKRSLSLLLDRAENYLQNKLKQNKLNLTSSARELLLDLADGDGRILLNYVETLSFFAIEQQEIDDQLLLNILQKRRAVYDKNQDWHYNLVSALHKSIRGSDPDAALYYLARMLEAGEDPLFLARRLIRIAVEDIGLADPQALVIANAAKDAYNFIGSPEGELALANVVIYLATAPKSNAAYKAYKNSREAACKYSNFMPPMHILNAPTKLMGELGYGKDYIYDQETKYGFSGQKYFPTEMEEQNYYIPAERGFEREIKKRLDWWSKLRKKINSN